MAASPPADPIVLRRRRIERRPQHYSASPLPYGNAVETSAKDRVVSAEGPPGRYGAILPHVARRRLTLRADYLTASER